MFLGEFQHSLDAKGRVILPSRFRDELDGGAVMAKALDGCLAVYPAGEFEKVAERVRDMAQRGATERQAARSFFAGALEVAPDKQGRVAVPAHLRDFAGLTRDVVVVGNLLHIEIWDAERWRDADRVGAAAISAADELPALGM
ncbi:MAG TPA: division/cell wall cluster transcriptional repressor MraZ [Acidimicrobiia bacterium]|nr:division/cell wall cluster transcriptional repressor MraZ [Acidimicrobiia bacterium]